jgi:hypothetical protein
VCQGVCYPRQPLDRLLRVSNVPQHCFSLAGAEAGGLSSVCSLLKKFVPREQLSSIEHECASGQWDNSQLSQVSHEMEDAQSLTSSILWYTHTELWHFSGIVLSYFSSIEKKIAFVFNRTCSSIVITEASRV